MKIRTEKAARKAFGASHPGLFFMVNPASQMFCGYEFKLKEIIFQSKQIFAWVAVSKYVPEHLLVTCDGEFADFVDACQYEVRREVKLVLYNDRAYVALVPTEKEAGIVVNTPEPVTVSCNEVEIFDYTSNGAKSLFSFFWATLTPLFNTCDAANTVRMLFRRTNEGFYADDMARENRFVVPIGQAPDFADPVTI